MLKRSSKLGKSSKFFLCNNVYRLMFWFAAAAGKVRNIALIFLFCLANNWSKVLNQFASRALLAGIRYLLWFRAFRTPVAYCIAAGDVILGHSTLAVLTVAKPQMDHLRQFRPCDSVYFAIQICRQNKTRGVLITLTFFFFYVEQFVTANKFR